jgi:hypothetical protein
MRNALKSAGQSFLRNYHDNGHLFRTVGSVLGHVFDAGIRSGTDTQRF